MSDAYDLGDPVPLELLIEDENGAPADPATVELVLVRPDGTTIGPVDGVEHPELGRFTFVPTPEVEGAWLARWTTTGVGAGETEYAFIVRPPGSALPYSATVEGVRARVLDVAAPTGAVPIGGAARAPRISNARVAEWLLEGGARVARKLRAIDQLGTNEADPVRLEYRAAARALTELYAAALLWDATYPQASKNGDRYGAVLYARYEKGLADLAGDLTVDVTAAEAAKAVVDEDPGDLTGVYGGGGAAARFPVLDPRISRHRPW